MSQRKQQQPAASSPRGVGTERTGWGGSSRRDQSVSKGHDAHRGHDTAASGGDGKSEATVICWKQTTSWGRTVPVVTFRKGGKQGKPVWSQPLGHPTSLHQTGRNYRESAVKGEMWFLEPQSQHHKQNEMGGFVAERWWLSDQHGVLHMFRIFSLRMLLPTGHIFIWFFSMADTRSVGGCWRRNWRDADLAKTFFFSHSPLKTLYWHTTGTWCANICIPKSLLFILRSLIL